MGEKGRAFAKGGCGCLLVFAGIAFVAVIAGGRAHVNLGGAVFLFVVGGLVGIVVLAIYNQGKRDAD